MRAVDDVVEVVFDDDVTSPIVVGKLRRYPRAGFEAVGFSYADEWLTASTGFALEPGLPRLPGTFTPKSGRAIFGALGDSAPDSWGRRLMARRARRDAVKNNVAMRALSETDYLLGVDDVARLGALRYRRPGGPYEAQNASGVPPVIQLGKLLHASDRVLRNEDDDNDLALILAPGSSLGGARPKASIANQLILAARR